MICNNVYLLFDLNIKVQKYSGSFFLRVIMLSGFCVFQIVVVRVSMDILMVIVPVVCVVIPG